MSTWLCGLTGCGRNFDGIESLIRHQVTEHSPVDCRICGESVPAGYCAIRHAFTAHTRAEYLRAYEANSDDIRHREDLLDQLEPRLDLAALLDDIDSDADGTAAMSLGD